MKVEFCSIKSLLFLAAIFCLVNLSVKASDKTTQAEYHYQQALNFYEKDEREKAIEELKIALRFNSKLSKAYNKLALIYMDEGTVYGRFKATFELEKAIRLEPHNLEYRYNEAILNMKKGFAFVAKNKLKTLATKDPDNCWIYYHLATMAEEQMIHYQDMISVDRDLQGIIYMDSFAEELKEEASEFYKKAIAVNPKFSDAYYRLALINYEFNNYDEMIQLLQSAVKVMPEDKNCHLFLGFGYQNLRKFQDAAKEYRIAKNLMNPLERDLLESIESILHPEQFVNFNRLSNSEKELFNRSFWASKDPFYLTDINERELEHCSRMAYANLRFSKPEKNIEGWQTDRGKVMIRYGKPRYKYRTRSYIGAYVGRTRNPLNHSKEYWIYPDFSFIFEDEYLTDNYSFAWGDRPENDYKEIFHEMIKVRPDYYRAFPDSQLFNIPYDIVTFKGQNGRTELEVCYSIPINSIEMSSSENDNYNLLKGIFLFDQFWNPVVENKRELNFQKGDILNLYLGPYYVQHEPIEVKPGCYHFALEFLDKVSGRISRSHKNVGVDTFLHNKFQISDILFADDLEVPNLNVPTARSDFQILPNPMRIYENGKSIVIYYEIYNLSSNSMGETRYKVEYRIGKDLQELSAIIKILTNLGLKKKRGQVTSIYENAGISSTELQYQKIVLDPKLFGEISLNVTVTDLISGSISRKQERFTIIKNLD